MVSTASPPGDDGSPPGLTALPGSHGWWYVVSTEHQNGGVWNGYGHQPGQVLSWCPEVLARLAALNADGTCDEQHYVVRVNQQLALLSDSGLPEGRGWEQFTAIDLWETFSFKNLLARVVQAQAERLPRIVFWKGEQ
ncbi:hypothetical protein ACFV2N_44375 [Streptomyces sp. NPDC059680]|uniref:hypothetical protein n=1 Tax=Streptomyces sp. NPDC059680 TaxID=3346904 RepID=UPI0036CA7AE1